MNRTISILLILCIALIAGYVGASYNQKDTKVTKPESAYERVIRTGTLRCGYYVFAPAMSVDTNTKKMTGFAIDMTNDLAKRLSLKVEWTEEVNFGTMMESLRNNRFDAICTPVWINAAQGRLAQYSRDLFYSPLIAIARVDDMRFEKDLSAANDPSVTIAIIDGEINSAVAADDFPKAKTLSIPNISSLSQLFMNVADKKADLLFTDFNGFYQYNKINPNKLKVVANKEPVRIYPFAYAVGKEETALLSTLNNALTEMLYDGTIEKIVKNNELFTDSYLYVAKPYRNQ